MSLKIWVLPKLSQAAPSGGWLVNAPMVLKSVSPSKISMAPAQSSFSGGTGHPAAFGSFTVNSAV